MFRFFVVICEVLALVAILRTPFVQYWFSDIQSAAADWMYEMSLVVEKKQLAEFRTEIAPYTHNLNEYQKDYLLQITDNKNTLSNFNRLYCEARDKNPYIYGASLRYLCSEIQRKGVIST